MIVAVFVFIKGLILHNKYTLEFSFEMVSLKCCTKFNFLSRVIPKYIKQFTYSKVWSFMNKGVKLAEGFNFLLFEKCRSFTYVNYSEITIDVLKTSVTIIKNGVRFELKWCNGRSLIKGINKRGSRILETPAKRK